ncbi:putative Glycosyl transferase, group 2 family [uncultured Paludibacter sp.]|nr:putative Glycosyl transferase, group 2 family [uncultured Paludibacter sp.]
MNKKGEDTTPSVSVLMPVYNVEKYVAEAIENILNQTFTDFELILLDDCSPDKSADIIHTFKDDRIVYHRNEKNLGLANNLNIGLKLAKGKYIARADSDDISLQTRLETQINFLELHPDIDLCSCGLQMFGQENAVWIRESDPEQVKITMMFYSPVLHATSVWRRESFEKNNLYYDQNSFPAEDYDLWSRAIFFCRLVNIPQVLYKYRIHGIQVTKTDDRVTDRDRKIKIAFLHKALPSLRKENIEDFIDKFIQKQGVSIQNINSLKSIYKSALEANKKERFFNQELLETRLKRYYQNVLFELLKNEKEYLKNINLLKDLRLKQIFKIFI